MIKGVFLKYCNEIKFFWWKVNFGIEWESRVIDGKWIEGFKYADCCREFFDEGCDPDDALWEEMSCWDG